MISSKSCLSVLAGREWDVGAGRAKPRCHHTPALLCPHLWLCLFSLSGMVEGKDCPGADGFAVCRGTLGCYTSAPMSSVCCGLILAVPRSSSGSKCRHGGDPV